MIEPFFTFLDTFHGQKSTSPQGKTKQPQGDSQKSEGIQFVNADRKKQ